MPPEPDALRRRRTHGAGQRAEWLALLWLALKGYRVLARRYGVRGGEVDLIMRRGPTIVFVEVKARPTRAEAMTAVTASKSRRVARAAGVWLSRNPWASALTLRGDIVAIAPRRVPCHLPNAFPLEPEQ